jgi:hypothetical protein
MTVEQGLAFLQAYQPMPDDSELSEELVREYDEVRGFFLDHPDARCIPLFLMSFGEGDGFGVYQLVEDVLRHFGKNLVVPHLRTGLTHARRSIRYWNAEIAANFPTPELIEPLAQLLTKDDEDLRSSAAIALGQIKDVRAEGLLRDALANERKPYLVSLFQKLLHTTSPLAARG